MRAGDSLAGRQLHRERSRRDHKQRHRGGNPLVAFDEEHQLPQGPSLLCLRGKPILISLNVTSKRLYTPVALVAIRGHRLERDCLQRLRHFVAHRRRHTHGHLTLATTFRDHRADAPVLHLGEHFIQGRALNRRTQCEDRIENPTQAVDVTALI